ncbi:MULTISPECIES: sensor domain-containing protein [unclassified Halomonas]|uniref:sensor domain-containing protein n=1 Tax=unclassified Halomonas TaxID=2609666 RepID=UPI000990719F|nr:MULTISPECIES: GGDEF domain-containing phosphodiesterase [unclassified Halomonas]AQU84318.1 GGDEF domain-containing protein [Halomonas sp. 'Soap Lake \
MSPEDPQGRLDQFFLLSQDMFCCIDFAGTLLNVNPMLEELLGYTADEMLGRSCGKVVYSRDFPVIEAALARLRLGETLEAFDIRALASTGQLLWLEVTASVGGEVIYVIARDITRRKAVEKQLARNQRLFQIVGETALIGGWYVDLPKGLPVWSNEVCRLHGVPHGFQPTVEEAIAFYTPGAQIRIREVFTACCRTGESFDEELEIVTQQGRRRGVRVIGKAVYDEHGHITQVQGSTQDISERKATERQLALLKRSVESSTNGVVIVDALSHDLPIVYVNAAFERMTGYPREAALGRNCRFLQGEETDRATLLQLHKGIEEQREVHVVIRNYRRNGVPFWNDLYVSPVRDEQGVVTHFLGVQNDITEQREYQALLRHNASHDALTGLPNRLLLNQRLAQGCLLAKRYHRYLAVLFVDLDDFKPINDSLGHEVGDFLLIEVAKRLNEELRPWDTVARFGGDEFIVLLPDLAREQDVVQVVERLLTCISAPYWYRESELRITASIGIATDDGAMHEPRQLIQQADLAMYKAKRRGRNTYQWYTDELNRKVTERVNLRHALQQAIEQGQFELHYQPQIHGPTERVIGVEALLRWHHPTRGNIPPAQFISLAEDTGQIIPISEWVLATACRDAVALNTLGHGPMTMAVNISPMQFQRPGFLASIEKALNESGLAPDLLELELTEGVLMDSAEHTIQALHALRSMGVHIALDDFGTGFSSLSYLKRLPINKLKVDRSFVREVVNDSRDAAIVDGVVAMAAKLGLEVLIEGIETSEQFGYFEALQCEHFQGFYFARPMPLSALYAFLQTPLKTTLAVEPPTS